MIEQKRFSGYAESEPRRRMSVFRAYTPNRVPSDLASMPLKQAGATLAEHIYHPRSEWMVQETNSGRRLT
jgi:hypothetical protein